MRKCFVYAITSFHSLSVDQYSLLRSNSWNGFSPNLNTRRWITSGELSSVLRPFYFAVHPDLFGQHPEQRVIENNCFFIQRVLTSSFNFRFILQTTNEESLKHLSAYLEALQSQRLSSISKPKHINFYVRDQNSRG